METLITLDTHIAVWLHAGELERIPASALKRLESEQIYISPMVLLELQYLREIKRINVKAEILVSDLASEIDLLIAKESFSTVINESLRQTWTSDPFDRVICAQALVGRLDLLTKDKSILKHCPVAFWD